jgi:HEAT repeat protein
MRQNSSFEDTLYQLLQEWLSQQEPNLLADFERDPEGTADRLRVFLERTNATPPPTLATYVSGGQIDKLINIAQVGAFHIHLAKPEPTLTPEEKKELEHRYLQRTAKECRYLDSEGVDRVRPELTDVFVMLQAVETPRQETETDVAPVLERVEEMGLAQRAATSFERRQAKQEEHSPSPPPVPLSQALGTHTHLVILGEPGTGKTTTLQFVALCFATHGWAKIKLDLDETRVPVRVTLREYDGTERLDRFLMRWLDRAYVPEPLTQDWLTDGRLAILLDGLDEVPETHRAAVTEAIERFATTPEGHHCRIVIASRIAGHRKGRNLGGNFGRYTICPFTGSQDAQLYVASWLQVLKSMAPEQAKSEAKAFLEKMEQQDGLRRVMSNPLLLRLAAAVYVETGEPARSRAELYRRYVQKVAWKRAKMREQPPWSRNQVEETLEAVAWALQARGEQTVNALTETVEGEIAGITDGEVLLDYLREQLGLLAIYGYKRGNLVAFRHLTFQEYFVAQRLKRAWVEDPKRSWRFLRPRLHHPTWREPILLLAGMLDQEETTNLTYHVLKAHSPYEWELCRDLLLAAALLEEGAPIATGLANRITDCLTRISLSTSNWKIRVWLAEFPHLQAVFTLHQCFRKQQVCAPLRDIATDRLASLARSQLMQIVKSLIQALKDKNSSVRETAARALGKTGNPRSVELLISAIEGVVWFERETPTETLKAISDHQAVEPLIHALTDADSHVRGAAARALGEIGDPRALQPLIRVMQTPEEEYSHVCWEVVGALGEIGGPQAVETLIRALGDPDWLVRELASEALAKIGESAAEPLIQALEYEDEVCWMAIETLGKIDDPRTVEPIIHALKDKDEQIRWAGWAAVEALDEIGVQHVVEPLIQALQDKEEQVRRTAVKALGKSSDSRAMATLIQALQDKNEQVRWAAAEALGRTNDPCAVKPLIQALQDKDEQVQWAATEALGEIGAQHVMEPLIQALQDKNEQVRRAAAEALSEIGAQHAVEPLIQALQDKDEQVRWAVAEALGKTNDPRAVESLIQALQDKDEQVRQAAAEALGKIGAQHAVESLIRALQDKDEQVRRTVAEALGKTHDLCAVEPLTQALQDKNEQVRRAVAEALGKTHDLCAVEPLIQALQDKNEQVRQAAAEALGEIGAPHAVNPLTRALQDKDEQVRWTATEALGEIGAQHAVEPLIRALQDKDEQVRRTAAKALGQISDKFEDQQTTRRIAVRLQHLLTNTDIINAVWEALALVVARLTELEVAALSAELPPFDYHSTKDWRKGCEIE